jgi:site-specific recombinase XerD
MSRYVLPPVGSFEEFEKAKGDSIVARLRELSSDASLTLIQAEEGSVRLVLEGTRDGFERIKTLFQSGKLVQELGVDVADVAWLGTTADDEHLNVLGKCGERRTVLLDDARLVGKLRAYVKQTGYRRGPLFRAAKNGRRGLLRYQTVPERWAAYCAQAGIYWTLHQLRHTHATELINGGVSLATMRKRLGYKNLQTTLRYAEQSDATADAEVRVWRRRQSRSR